MATFLAIPPATTAGQVALTSASVKRLPTTVSAANVSAALAPDSTTVTLSDAARVLSVIGSTANDFSITLGTTSNISSTVPIPASNDILAGEQNILNARLALQALIDDPGLRAIKNQADPLYSALIAASHLSDFVPTAAQGVNAAAIVNDVPTPISPVAVSRAIDFYRETAEDTRRPLVA